VKKIYARLALTTGTSIDFFARQTIGDLAEYIEVIKEAAGSG